MNPGSSLTFKATVTGPVNKDVSWMVSGIVGGNQIVSTVSAAGVHTALTIDPETAVTILASARQMV